MLYGPFGGDRGRLRVYIIQPVVCLSPDEILDVPINVNRDLRLHQRLQLAFEASSQVRVLGQEYTVHRLNHVKETNATYTLLDDRWRRPRPE